MSLKRIGVHSLLILSSSKQIQSRWIPITLHPTQSLPNPRHFFTDLERGGGESPISQQFLLSRSDLAAMKRSADSDDDTATGSDKKMKKIKPEEQPEEAEGSVAVLMDENLLYEVLKHVDARTLATAACVSKQWHKTAQDERLWELICTRHWANIGCGNQQLRSVVLALGGFRGLYSQYLLPLSKPLSSSSSPPAAAASSSSSWPCFPPSPPVAPAKPASGSAKTRCLGKDEVHLSLSLLSIRYYEKMNFNNRGKGL